MNRSALISILITAALLITLIPQPLYANAEENPPVDRGDGVLENSGDWIIEEGDNIQFTEKTIIVNGNLTVNGTLSLTRCHLIMNNSYSNLTVNGALDLDTTNITGNNTYYYFIIYGILDFHDSNLFHIAGSGQYPYIGGLQLLSEDVSMEGGSIQGGEFTGIYITTNVTISNMSIINNIYNVVMNGSSPGFINCTIRFIDFPNGSANIFMMNGSHPIFVEGVQAGETIFYDELSSMGFGHTLHVHVTYENGTSIPGVTVTVTSSGEEISEQRTTDESGWVRNLLLPEETIYKSIPDKVYRPYRVTVEKFGLMVMESIPFESETTLEMVLTGDYFGETLTRGDYNGDGFPDLAVGVPRNRTGITTPGAVFVFLNRGDLELTEIDESMADLTIRGVDGTGFGSVLASGDINGDGFDDLLLGTPSSSENGPGSGRVYFFFGNPTPAWNELDDASLTFEGDEGSHYGSRIFVENLNNDAFTDFVIGDDGNSYVYYSTANPDEDFTLVSEVYAVASTKGVHDTTGESISKIQTDDDDRYTVQHPNTPNNILHITNFTFGNLLGEVTSATLWFQFATDRYYGYNDHERNYIYYNVGDGWKQSIRPRYNQQNWRDESTWPFDLFANGVTSMDQLGQLQVYLSNIDGTNNSQANNNIYFDYIAVHATVVPKGANHTLGAGNLSSGDVNGDGHPDLIISDVSGQTIYYGGPLGLSAPEILSMDLRQGNATRLLVKSGNLTISETRPYLNGQFDDGWFAWNQVANSLGQKDGNTRWDIVETENGDWKVHDGPTGGFGVDQDTLDGDNNRDCRGMLRTNDFLITEDMETLHFWYNFGARSFERAGGNQGNTADQIRYRLYAAGNNSVLMELAGWAPTESSEGHDENGIVDADITGLRGEEVYFGFEIITNRGNSDRGIAQIDNLTILPPSAIPYYENGSLESPWYEFEGNISTFTPVWNSDTSDGQLSVKFRTDPATDWDETTESVNGQRETVNASSDRLQYLILMGGDGSGTPVLSELELGILLEGQILPLSLATNYGTIDIADMNGDGFGDLLLSHEGGGGSRGAEGIDLYYGRENFSANYQTGDIQDFYTGEFMDFSVLDLESDGTNELCLIGDSIRIIDSATDIVWEKSVMASRMSGDVASDPNYHLNTGAIHFIPSHDNDIRVIDIEIPELIDPDSPQLITLVFCNVGTEAQTDLTYYWNITGGDYTLTESHEISIQPFETEDIGILWDVPVDEGITYTFSLEVPLSVDRLPSDNSLIVHATSKQHGVLLTTNTPVLAAHGGDQFTYNVTIENTGTFDTENVTLSSALPPGWTGEFKYLDVPVDYVVVADSVNLTFITASPIDEEEGNFTVNLTGTAATAVSYLDTTATVLRPDLIIEEIRLVRADGVITNDTIHGVSGDAETIEIQIRNQGPTYSTATRLWLWVNTDFYEEFMFDRIEPGESKWFSSGIVPEVGDLQVDVEVDPDSGVVPEQNESNNMDSREFTVKGQDPIGPYEITGSILDIQGEGVGFAEVTFEWNGNNENIFTDEDGNYAFTIETLTYHDTTLLYLNATDGENITSIQVILYSEDGGKHLILTLNQYLVEMEGPDTVSSIDINGTIIIQVDVTNKGNVNTSFVVEASEVPDDWTVEILDLPEGRIALSIGETATVDIRITSSDDPLLAKGHQKYFATIHVFSEIYPPGNDSFTHGIVVRPMQSILVVTDGENATIAQPGEEIGFSFIVENLGNQGNTFIPELVGSSAGEVEEHEFDITYLSLDIGESAEFSLALTMPFLALGTELELMVGGAEDHIISASVFLTALEFYGIQYDCTTEFSAEPGDILSIPISITNTGNLEENITVTGWTGTPDVQIAGGDVILAMLEETIFFLGVTLPEEALAGAVIPVDVELSTGPSGIVSFQFGINITILEVYGLSLTLLETTVTPAPDFTIYSYEIEAENRGNGENTFHFKAEGTHPHYLALPGPLTLGPGVTLTIYAEIIVPLNSTGVIDNYLVAVDVRGDYSDLNLRILSYNLDIETTIVMSQTDSSGDTHAPSHPSSSASTYYYDVSVTNNGERFERIELFAGIPKVDTYQSGDTRWEGGINKDFLEIFPGDTEDFRVWVTTPDLREYWGSALVVNLESDSGKTDELTLHKPPIPILGVTIPDDASFEDTITFTGSQSLWNIMDYQWDLGDGSNASGSSVSYSYGKSGTYEVTLTITDDMGFTASRSSSVEIVNQLPLAIIQTSPKNRTVEAGLPITLDSSFSHDRDGEIVSYLWEFGEFGDFYEGTWPVIQHIYETTGVFTVTLNVRDNFGATTNTSVDVTVIPRSEDKPEDPIIEEKTTTDPMSYIPVTILVLVVLAGVIFLLRKKMFIDHLVWKISDQSERERKL